MNYYRIAQNKYKKALKIIRILRYVPGVKMIAICNTLSYNMAQDKSDIDLFIITKKKRIWTVRFLATLVLVILRLRPDLKSGKVKDKVCLSFFLSENNYNIEKYKISVQDTYLPFWIKHLVPIYNEKDTYTNFIQANNWAYQDSCLAYKPNYKRRLKQSFLKPIINFFIFIVADYIYKYIQLAIMPKELKLSAQKWDTKVIISNSILKLHLKDRRLELKDSILCVL